MAGLRIGDGAHTVSLRPSRHGYVEVPCIQSVGVENYRHFRLQPPSVAACCRRPASAAADPAAGSARALESQRQGTTVLPSQSSRALMHARRTAGRCVLTSLFLPISISTSTAARCATSVGGLRAVPRINDCTPRRGARAAAACCFLPGGLLSGHGRKSWWLGRDYDIPGIRRVIRCQYVTCSRHSSMPRLPASIL